MVNAWLAALRAGSDGRPLLISALIFGTSTSPTVAAVLYVANGPCRPGGPKKFATVFRSWISARNVLRTESQSAFVKTPPVGGVHTRGR